MAYDDLLVHTATVFRRQAGTDRFGQPLSNATAPSHTLPCYLTVAKGSERFDERTHDVVAVSHKLFLKLGADLKETDIVSVASASGTPLVTRANVKLVSIPRAYAGDHHVEADLSAQRAST